MKVEIINDTKNPLLSRRQIKFLVTHDGSATPKKIDVAEHLAAKLNVDINLMVIEGYTTQFGSNKSKGMCFVYDSNDAMNRAEPLKTLNAKKRVGGTREEAKEAAPAETEKKTEEPAGEKAKGDAVTEEPKEETTESTTEEKPTENVTETKEEPENKPKGETDETQSKQEK